MARDECVAQIRNAAGEGEISDEQATHLIERIETKRRQAKMNAASESMDSLDAQVLKEVQDEIAQQQMAAIIQKRNAAINIQKATEARGYVENFKNPYDAIVASIAGINSPVKGSRESASARVQSLKQGYFGGLINDLKKSNLLPYFKEHGNSLNIARELWALDERTTKTPGYTGDKAAQGLAAILKKYQDDAVDRMNNAGAWINKRAGYIVRQSHDMSKIRRAGFDQWKLDILPSLDIKQTFGDLPESQWDDFLKHSYDALTKGYHLVARGGEEADGFVAGFSGAGNVAKKSSQGRVLRSARRLL